MTKNQILIINNLLNAIENNLIKIGKKNELKYIIDFNKIIKETIAVQILTIEVMKKHEKTK